MKRELRMAAAGDFKVKRAEGEPVKIVGYAARFNDITEIGGMFREKILPGAFRDSIAACDVRALFNHDPNRVLGRTANGTLVLAEDEFGLRYEITPPDTQDARDVMALLERGDVSGSSFSFALESGDSEWDDDPEMPTRTIKRVAALFDVGPVTYPAYPTTTAGARSAEEVRAEFEAVRATITKNKGESRAAAMLKKRLDVVEL